VEVLEQDLATAQAAVDAAQSSGFFADPARCTLEVATLQVQAEVIAASLACAQRGLVHHRLVLESRLRGLAVCRR